MNSKIKEKRKSLLENSNREKRTDLHQHVIFNENLKNKQFSF